MIGIFQKFFRCSGKQSKRFYKSLVISLIHAVFEAIRIPAIAVVLTALLEGTVTMKTVWTSLGIMLVSIIGCMFSRLNMTMEQTIGGYTMAADKRVEIGERMKYMPMGYFNKNSIGTITSITTNTVENLQEVATRVVQLTLQGVLTTAVITLAILLYEWRIGLVIVAGIIVFLAVNALMQKRSRHLAPIKTSSDEELVSAALEYIQGISVVKSYNLYRDANKKVNDAILKNAAINTKMEKTFVPYTCMQSFVLRLFSILMVFCSVALYLNGTMELINCMLMVVSSFLIYAQLDNAGSFSALLRVIDVSVDKINEVYEAPMMDTQGADIQPSDFDIKGEHVDFSYDKKKILHDVSFSIPQGTTTAVIGPSGGGKTTLCHLMARFWDVENGKITLGGRDIREYTLDSLLKNFSMVFQHVYLFGDTIENNIKFGKPDATREEVEEAAKKACCHAFIRKLPDGYQTVIGEAGATISGGEKQRISIARALLKDAPIIILDEATANVDPENEKQLQLAIEELTKDKTIIMIAHRLKTVRNADQILVLDQGRIRQRGTHRQLMQEGGIYADFIGMRKKTIGWKLGGSDPA